MRELSKGKAKIKFKQLAKPESSGEAGVLREVKKTRTGLEYEATNHKKEKVVWTDYKIGGERNEDGRSKL